MKLFPKSRRDNLVIQEFEKEILIYDLKVNKAFCLNQTSALAWQECDGNKSIARISEIISQKLETPVNEDFVMFTLKQLKKEDLIENDLPDFFAGTSRREVIKRIGLATMVALPVVTSFVAPLAANAASVNCTACARMNNACTPGCENVLGTCFDNAGCGGGQTIANVTCAQCKSGVPFAGGVATGSWQGS